MKKKICEFVANFLKFQKPKLKKKNTVRFLQKLKLYKLLTFMQENPYFHTFN